MTTGLYEKVSAAAMADERAAGFGGWLAFLWSFALLLVIWHVTSVTGNGRGLDMMFETPENAAIMRVVLWMKVWLWAPFLILAPLEHRLMPAVTIVSVLTAVIGEACVTAFLLDLSRDKIFAVTAFNAMIGLLYCAYLIFSKRAAAIRKSTRPVDVRVRRHFTLLLLVAGSASLAIFGAAAETVPDRVSFLSAYQFLLLLSAVLTIGPVRTLRTGRMALNIHLRRDIAVWVGVAGLLHLYTGTVESMTPLYIASFVAAAAGDWTPDLRQQLFTWGTIVGLAIAPLVMLLLALSNDRSILRLGKRWWKRLQRTSYVVLFLTVVHGIAFQFLEYRAPWLVAVGLFVVTGIVAVQIAGFVTVRRKRRRRLRKSG